MSRHPMWRPSASRPSTSWLCSLVRLGRASEPMFGRVAVAVAFGLFAMMALRVALAWLEHRL